MAICYICVIVITSYFISSHPIKLYICSVCHELYQLKLKTYSCVS